MGHAIAAAGDDLSVTVRPLTSDFARSTARERILAVLSAFFGALALSLSALGFYGVVSHGVAARRAEFGIRMALGASRMNVLALAVRRIAVLFGIGALLGVPLSIWTARLVSALLFGVQPLDPTIYVVALAILAATGILAAVIPASRAVTINPAITLRAD